jgi:hypothetical protein
MTYKPIVLQRWEIGTGPHRLIVNEKGHLELQFSLADGWYPCNMPEDCLPLFRRPRAKRV